MYAIEKKFEIEMKLRKVGLFADLSVLYASKFCRNFTQLDCNNT